MLPERQQLIQDLAKIEFAEIVRGIGRDTQIDAWCERVFLANFNQSEAEEFERVRAEYRALLGKVAR